MSISTPFIHRPVATVLLSVAVGLAGSIAYQFLPVSALPQVEFPTLQVSATLPGASPETMASSVATPLERQFGRIAGITEMTSTSLLGSTTVVLQFDLDRNIDAAARDVQAAINAARGQLPSNLPNNPTWRKVNPADAPVLILSLSSETYSPAQMYDAGSTVLAQKLSQVDGVGQVLVTGGALPAVRVEVNPLLLSGLGLGLEDVRTALANANVNRPKGQIMDGDRSWALSTTDQLFRASEYGKLIIAFRNGAPVRVADVATVVDSVEDVRQTGTWKDRTTIFLILFRQPGSNLIATVDRVLALMPILKEEIPKGIAIDVVLDRTTVIRSSVKDVEITLILSIGLVVLVVFVFLRNLRATFIPSVAVPISLIGTFGVMYLGGYSIDNLSLMALTIATGFVVDDAIVVIENISRHLEEGMAPLEAALVGAREIGFTVLSISLSLVAVFIPILLMGGIIGRLFREFAVTLSVAIGVSLAVSLTTTPMMCAMLLKHRTEEKHGALFNASERVFVAVLKAYQVSLSWVLRHHRLTMLATVATVALTVFLYIIVPKGFFPQQDSGRLVGAVIADQDTSYQAMTKVMERFSKVVGSDPAVEGAIAVTGGSRGSANTAIMYIPLKPIEERKLDADHVIARLRAQASKVAGSSLFLQPVQDLRIGGRPSSSQYQFTLQGENLDELNSWAPKLQNRMKSIPGIVDVTSDQLDRGLQTELRVDRATASRLGISTRLIDDTLYDAFGQRQVSTMYTQANQYHVVLEVEPRYGQHPEGLKYIYTSASGGAQVPLAAVTRNASSTASLMVNHSGQFPSVTISFNLRPGVSLGDAVEGIQLAQHEMGLPASIHGSFSGAAQAFQASIANEPLLIAAALVAVYIVLGMLYESLIHPLTILSTLPSAGVGALLALMLCRTELNVMGLIGILLLIGIVKKNAIMMIDFAIEAERKGGKTPEESIFQACMLRFRPITMTTLAALLGGLPLALGSGPGSELRRPMGIAIVGGLIFSQMLTLYTTPVVYLYMDRMRLWLRKAWRSRSGDLETEVSTS